MVVLLLPLQLPLLLRWWRKLVALAELIRRRSAADGRKQELVVFRMLDIRY